ncbi:basic proline-rich protein-like [Bubalus kerabau]|uniref:basic proline-rich protein-like n=1 Tax=Bubalus carabanensis TaxID=3119969 RepID=UPI00244E6073|nr:basic proline-rich protein-like [Bubalus carabanensis]
MEVMGGTINPELVLSRHACYRSGESAERAREVSEFPGAGTQVLGPAGARSPAPQPPLRFPAMAPRARAGAARGGHPPGRSKRLDRSRRGTILGWTLPGRSPPDPPPPSRVEALQPRSSKVPDRLAGDGTASAAAPLAHSPRVPSGLLPTYSKVGPKWPPQSSRGRAPRRLSAPPGGVQVGRAPGWGRRAASCPSERLARALRAPLLQGSARRPARAPRSSRPPGADTRAAHAPDAGDIPPLPATPARAGARFSRTETLDPTFPRAAGHPPARRTPGAAKPGQGISEYLEGIPKSAFECRGCRSALARRNQVLKKRLDRGTSQARVTNPKACLPRRTPPDPQGCGDKRQLVPPRALSHPGEGETSGNPPPTSASPSAQSVYPGAVSPSSARAKLQAPAQRSPECSRA